MYNYYQITLKQTFGLEMIQNTDSILEIAEVLWIELISLPIFFM